MIREATPQDLTWLTELWTEWFQEEPVPHYTAAQALYVQLAAFHAALTAPSRSIVLVEPPVAALLWMSVGNPDEIHDMGLFVQKASRNEGIGTELGLEALRLAKEKGFKRTVISPLESNPRTKEWLLRRGFRVHQIVMVKEL